MNPTATETQTEAQAGAEQHARRAETIKQLNRIRWIAIVDFILLVPLVLNFVGAIEIESVVPILGPIHGFGFLGLVYLCWRGALEERWGWWFPVIVVVTLGPIGSLYGEHRVRTQLSG